ncbi:MAG: hypothetical protein Q4E69_07240 [Bacilli bacterium]|nr:hypothetical protein [Bacilli bacterium]
MKRIKIGMKKLINNTQKTLKRIKTEHLIKAYFKDNVLFITFVLTVVLNSTMLRFFCMHTIENYLSFKAVLADLTIAVIIGSFGYLFKPKNRFAYYLILDIILSAICMINSAYYTFYTSFASVSMLSLTQYIGDVGDAVVENVIQLKDLFYVLGPVILILVQLKLNKKHANRKKEENDFYIRSWSSNAILLLYYTIFTRCHKICKTME